MPLKNGELSGPEIRKLIRGHNKLAQIKVPTGLDRDGLIKFLKSKKYTVDHKRQRLIDTTTGNSRGRDISLATAKSITKPQPKSDAQKATTKAKKDEKAKVMKSKEDAIKAEGVKQGAALQRVVSKRASAKPAPKPAPKPKAVPVLQLGDKSPVTSPKIKKAERKRLDKDFREKYKMNIYQALEIPNNSNPSPAEIKQICRKLKLKNHPDKGGSVDKFQAIDEACKIMNETFQGADEPDEVDISPTLIKTQKEAISKYVKTYTAAAIKKLSTRDQVNDAFSKGQDLYNEIQQRFTKPPPNGFGFSKKSEMTSWFADNISPNASKTYIDTEKLMKRRMTAQYKKVK